MGPSWELQVLRSGGSSLVSAAVSPIAQPPAPPAEQRPEHSASTSAELLGCTLPPEEVTKLRLRSHALPTLSSA